MSKHDTVLNTKRGDNNVDGLSNRDALATKGDLDIDALIRAGVTLPQARAAGSRRSPRAAGGSVQSAAKPWPVSEMAISKPFQNH